MLINCPFCNTALVRAGKIALGVTCLKCINSNYTIGIYNDDVYIDFIDPRCSWCFINDRWLFEYIENHNSNNVYQTEYILNTKNPSIEFLFNKAKTILLLA